MCNLYSSTTAQMAMRQLFTGLSDLARNLGPDTFYPDQMAPIIRHDGEGLELGKARVAAPTG
jgi:putative SOS response-associated peptidase YedK